MVKNILLRVGGCVGGGEEKWGLKLTSAKIEAEFGKANDVFSL